MPLIGLKRRDRSAANGRLEAFVAETQISGIAIERGFAAFLDLEGERTPAV
jgi:hypothetical protein